jgi:hypothetical protein
MVTSTITNVHKVTVCWVCTILTDLLLPRHILLKRPNTQFNVNPSSESRVMVHGYLHSRLLTYKNMIISPEFQKNRLQAGQTFRAIQNNQIQIKQILKSIE